MACGAFAAFKLATGFPELHIVLVFGLAGLITAGVGVLFGIPSLRIKASTSRSRRWPPSSSFSGCSIGCPGSRITLHPA